MSAGTFEFGSDVRVVIDFSVETDLERAVLVGHGLRGRVGQVQDSETAMTQDAMATGRDVKALAVWATVGHDGEHSSGRGAKPGRVRSEDAGYAAHEKFKIGVIKIGVTSKQSTKGWTCLVDLTVRREAVGFWITGSGRNP